MPISPVSKIVPLGGGRYHYLWRMLPDIPVSHQRGEAIADLMDFLRTLGMVLLSEPRASVRHGAKPVMTLTITARYASDREAHALRHPNNQEETAA